MTEQTQKQIYDQIKEIEKAANLGSARATPLAILLLCQIFMEYIKIEMDQHGQA